MPLKQIEGGVKMLNLREYIESKQINFMYKLIQSKYEHWNIIGSSPIFISSFGKSNIKMFSKSNFIWNTETKTFPEPSVIHDRLLDKAGWKAKYNKIITSFSTDITDILKGPNIPM